MIIRKNLIERTPDSVPIFLRYATHEAEKSLYNTPNTWGIYVLKLVTDHVDSLGGIAAMQKINEKKAATLYGAIDSSDYWRCPVDAESRSIMNVVWRLPSEELEEKFVKEAKAAGFDQKSQSVGGLTASDAVTRPWTLVGFMKV